jgi:hypothetical protein
MNDQPAVLDEVVAQALRLSRIDKVRLVERVAEHLEQDLSNDHPRPRRSLYGLWAHLGPAPSAEEIDEVRKEMWANFPRDDI